MIDNAHIVSLALVENDFRNEEEDIVIIVDCIGKSLIGNQFELTVNCCRGREVKAMD